MNALQEAEIIKSWEYCNSGGFPLTDEQLRDYDFKDWLQWLVEYTLPADYPEPPKPKSQKRRTDTKPKAIALPAKTSELHNGGTKTGPPFLRLDQFSTWVKMDHVEGGREVKRSVIVYSFKGFPKWHRLDGESI